MENSLARGHGSLCVVGPTEPPLSHCGAEFPFLCSVVGMGTSSTKQRMLPDAAPPCHHIDHKSRQQGRWDCDDQSGPQPENTDAVSLGVL